MNTPLTVKLQAQIMRCTFHENLKDLQYESQPFSACNHCLSDPSHHTDHNHRRIECATNSYFINSRCDQVLLTRAPASCPKCPENRGPVRDFPLKHVPYSCSAPKAWRTLSGGTQYQRAAADGADGKSSGIRPRWRLPGTRSQPRRRSRPRSAGSTPPSGSPPPPAVGKTRGE